MKSVLISIQPKWVEKIANGQKTIEVRKTRPKLETPFKCYIYCTEGDALAYPCINYPKFDIHRANNGTLKGRLMTKKEREQSDYLYANGKVIGEFVCDRVDKIGKRGVNNNFDYCYLSLNEWGNDDIEIEITAIKKSCISKEELNLYGANSTCLYGWHISDLVIYDKPKELSEFKAICNKVKHYETESKEFFEHCYKCEYLTEKTSCLDSFACGKFITRPPQSWCYIETGE